MPLYAKGTQKERKGPNTKRIFCDVSAGVNNPGSIHAEGVLSEEKLETARMKLAELFGVHKDSLYFTPSGTTANNLAILGWASRAKAGHIVTTDFEHPSVAGPIAELEKRGWSVTRVKPNDNGLIDAADIKKAIRRDTRLVSVIRVQNEYGTIQPTEEIARVVRAERVARGLSRFDTSSIVFHVDSCQSPGWLKMNIASLGADMVVWSGRKVHGGKNVGVLFVRAGIEITPIIFGGGQEKGMWPGTENVSDVFETTQAFEGAEKMREKKGEKVKKIRDEFVKKVLREIPDAKLNGDDVHRIPGNANFTFGGVEGELIVLGLDALGVACSTGSACKGKTSPGVQTVRFSFSHDVTKEQVVYITQCLKRVVERARRFRV